MQRYPYEIEDEQTDSGRESDLFALFDILYEIDRRINKEVTEAIKDK